MKLLLESANQYLKECSWKDLALVKICLCAAGIMIGVCIPRKRSRGVYFAALAAYVLTYIPLMVKFVRIVMEKKES